MEGSKVVKAVNFKSSKIQFADNVKTNKYNGKSVYVNYDGGPLRVQLPKMSLPFGIGKYINPEKPEEIRYSIEMSFDDSQQDILKQFESVEDRVVDYIEAKSMEIYKKKQNREILEEFHKSALKINEPKEVNGAMVVYPSRIKAKIYTEGDNFKLDVYDSVKVNGKYQKIHLDENNVEDIISKGCKCEAIIQSTGIWVVGKTFGISWAVAQLKIYKNANKLSGYAFDDDDDEEKEILVDQEQDEEQDEEETLEEETLEEVIKVVEAPKKTSRRKREEF